MQRQSVEDDFPQRGSMGNTLLEIMQQNQQKIVRKTKRKKNANTQIQSPAAKESEAVKNANSSKDYHSSVIGHGEMFNRKQCKPPNHIFTSQGVLEPRNDYKDKLSRSISQI